MQTRFFILALAAVVAAPLSAKPAVKPSADTGIHEGQILDDVSGKTVNGWQSKGGAMYPVKPGEGQAPGDAYACCVALFQKGNTFAVARTEPLERNPDGGVIKERVITVMKITALPGEEETMCEGLPTYHALSLKNEKTGMVRSVTVDPAGEMKLETWKDAKGQCGYGE
ncbi:MAG TPA: hypothetical protein PK680_03065 [Novosphingobium sp.]|nr:hypothetical protein [Novosphingobium sp.]HQA17345.1 hypothetical protein [Novosphingobium sp.]